jgi:hypothetical protein
LPPFSDWFDGFMPRSFMIVSPESATLELGEAEIVVDAPCDHFELTAFAYPDARESLAVLNAFLGRAFERGEAAESMAEMLTVPDAFGTGIE